VVFLEEETQELCNDSSNLFSFNKLKNVSATSDKARTIPFPACFSPHTTANEPDGLLPALIFRLLKISPISPMI